MSGAGENGEKVRAGKAGACKTKVGDDDSIILFAPARRTYRYQGDVGALEIAMNDSGLVRRAERRRHLKNYGPGLIWSHRSGAANALAERLTVQEFHAKEGDLVARPSAGLGRLHVMKDVKDSADIGMGHFPGKMNFLFEPRQGLLFDANIRPDGFQCDVLAQLQVFRFVDLSHPAPRQKANDLEPAVEDAARRKARMEGSGSRATLTLRNAECRTVRKWNGSV